MSTSAYQHRPRGFRRLSALLHRLRHPIHRVDRKATIDTEPIALTTPFPPGNPRIMLEVCCVCTNTASPTAPLRTPCQTCKAIYCTHCIKELFLRAAQHESSMPAKCCAIIPLHYAVPYLSDEEAQKYRDGFDQWNTNAKDRLYCPNPRCSTFISHRQILTSAAGSDTKVLQCPSETCGAMICKQCKQFAHERQPCTPDTERLAALEAAKKWGYKECPGCGNGVKRMFGCSHMMCICGAHWCWRCLKNIVICEEDDECYDDESDDDDYDDDAPRRVEQPEPEVELPTFEASALTRTPTAPELEQNDPEINDVQHPSARRASAPELAVPEAMTRTRNLDAGTHQFWAQQDLDFGHEPGQEDGNWACEHTWDAVEAKSLSVPHWERSSPKSKADRKDSGVSEKMGSVIPECHKCWDKIRVKKGHECTKCAFVICERCKGD